jgi:drug/metabolite transporter (DMT)-like permease
MKNADWALVISLGILWGMSFVFVELLLAYLSPFMIVYLRVAIGAFFLLAYIFIRKAAFDWSAETILTLIIMALLNNVVPFLLITIGQQTTTGGLASILNANTAFVTIVLAAALVPHETLTINRVVGALIGVVGVTMAIGYQNIFQLYDGNNGKYLICFGWYLGKIKDSVNVAHDRGNGHAGDEYPYSNALCFCISF